MFMVIGAYPIRNGLQIPFNVYPKEETESALWAGTAAVERHLSCVGSAEGVPDSERPSDV